MKENLIMQSKLNERIKELVVENEELKRKQKEEKEGKIKEQQQEEDNDDDDALFESGFFNWKGIFYLIAMNRWIHSSNNNVVD